MKQLTFKNSGYCAELGTSYYKGTLIPDSEEQYKALQKYAVQEKTDDTNVNTDDDAGSDDSLDDLKMNDVRAIAKKLNINTKGMKKTEIIDAINEANVVVSDVIDPDIPNIEVA